MATVPSDKSAGQTGHIADHILLNDAVDALNADITALSDHLTDTVDAHDASAISVSASGFDRTLTTAATTVQAVAQAVDDLPKIWVQSTEPTGAAANDVWIDTSVTVA